MMVNHLTIKEIKERIQTKSYTIQDMKQWRNDHRKGVQQLIDSFDRQLKKEERLKNDYLAMCTYETSLEQQGISKIAGIDEAGRGPLAGPVVAAAVILPKDANLYGLTDSKQLTEKERNYFYDKIKEVAISYHIQVISNTVIDDINIYEATKRAMIESVHSLHIQPEHLLVDAVSLPIEVPATVLTKGDQKSISIAAASVLAKVFRDKYMQELDQEYPHYQFAQHKGYGTTTHVDMLKKYGASPYHRKTFAPVKRALIHRG